MKPEFSQQIFEKHCNIKAHENPSTETPDEGTDRGALITKLTVTFRNFYKRKSAPCTGTDALYRPYDL